MMRYVVSFTQSIGFCVGVTDIAPGEWVHIFGVEWRVEKVDGGVRRP